MMMIKLKGFGEEGEKTPVIFANPSLISSMVRSSDDEYTQVNMSNMTAFFVMETPEQIINSSGYSQ
jgi:hypothetical protein